MRSASRGALSERKRFWRCFSSEEIPVTRIWVQVICQENASKRDGSGVEEVGNGREQLPRVPWQAKSSATPDPKSLEQKSYAQSFSLP